MRLLRHDRFEAKRVVIVAARVAERDGQLASVAPGVALETRCSGIEPLVETPGQLGFEVGHGYSWKGATRTPATGPAIHVSSVPFSTSINRKSHAPGRGG